MSTAIEITTSSPVQDRARELSRDLPSNVLRFLAVALQFGVLAVIARTFELDNPSFYAAVKVLWAGWVVHHFLALRFKLPFFALLSMALVVQALGLRDGLVLLAIGGVLIGACHLPIRFGARLVVVCLLAATLVALRADWVPAAMTGRIPPRVWPILGSMFMFRLIAYLYDLRHNAAPVGPWRAAAYFFMLPNACFPLFPVVDYKGFVKGHFAEETFSTYQIGLRWVWRGIVQLLLYQVVYLFWVTDPMQAATLGDVAWYALATFLLYLRVSGLFHLIVGLLRLFGFALPETHHLYYLSSSFTDFWRRINIYWKEFLTKVVFYPTFVRLKKLGEAKAMMVATLVAFAVTWFLHAYQLFWVRGRFPVTWQDLVFWFGLGGLVVVNMRWEATHKRARRLTKARRTTRENVQLALKTMGTFATLCILWTVWNTPSTGLRNLASAASHASVLSVLAIAGGLGVIGAAGVFFASSAREGVVSVAARPTAKNGAASNAVFWREAVLLGAMSMALLAVGKKPQLVSFKGALPGMVVQVEHVKFNRLDLLGRERGYYQDVNDALSLNTQVGRLDEMAPAGWHDNPVQRLRNDILLWDYRPSSFATFKREPFTTNEWGMRDRDYPRPKPLGTERFAIIGSSHEVGAGVPDSDTYENRAEALLAAAPSPRKYELLNFAVDGYAPLQKLAMMETRAFAFEPDVVLYMVHSNEIEWVTHNLDGVVSRRIEIPFRFVNDALQRADVHSYDSPDVIDHKLVPERIPLLRGVFERIAADCQAHHARGVVVLVDHSDEPVRPASLDTAATLARGAGLEVIDLYGAFDGAVARESLQVAPFDAHPNRQGHALLAARLVAELRSHGLLDSLPAATPRPSSSP